MFCSHNTQQPSQGGALQPEGRLSIMDEKLQSGIAMLAQIMAVGLGDVDVSF